jgi:TRAP-type C4-dicarboxylate transport system permease small subunit
VRILRTAIDRSLQCVLVMLMSIAVLNVLWQVFTRYILADSSSFTEEAARYLLLWISVIGAAYAVGGRMHLAIDLLPAKLAGRRAGAVLELFINLCIFLFGLLVLGIGGLALVRALLGGGATSAALGLKVGYVYTCLPLAGIIMILYAVLNTAERISRFRDAGASPQPPHQ